MGNISQATITITVTDHGPMELSDLHLRGEPPRGEGGELTSAQKIALDLGEIAVERARRSVELHRADIASQH